MSKVIRLNQNTSIINIWYAISGQIIAFCTDIRCTKVYLPNPTEWAKAGDELLQRLDTTELLNIIKGDIVVFFVEEMYPKEEILLEIGHEN